MPFSRLRPTDKWLLRQLSKRFILRLSFRAARLLAVASFIGALVILTGMILWALGMPERMLLLSPAHTLELCGWFIVAGVCSTITIQVLARRKKI